MRFNLLFVIIVLVSTAWPAAAQMLMHHDPQWLPDGKWLRVTVITAGKEELWLYPLDGGAAKRTPGIVAPPAPGSIESTSRDGKTLLFTEQARDGGQVIVATDAKRSSARRLTTNGWAEQPRFSPASDVIVYEARSTAHAIPESTINLMTSAGGTARVIARGTDPSWSPDGAQILFKTFAGNPVQLHIATIDSTGRNLRLLTPGVHPAWSPDGRRIAYMADTSPERTDVWFMNRDGTGRRCVTCTAK